MKLCYKFTLFTAAKVNFLKRDYNDISQKSLGDKVDEFLEFKKIQEKFTGSISARTPCFWAIKPAFKSASMLFERSKIS